jgi:hypothetical protein
MESLTADYTRCSKQLKMLNQCKTILVLRNTLPQLLFLIFIIHMEKQTRIDQNKRQRSKSNIKTKTQQMMIRKTNQN